MYYLREDSTHAKALQDYEVTDDRLLGFKKDEVITVTKKEPNASHPFFSLSPSCCLTVFFRAGGQAKSTDKLACSRPTWWKSSFCPQTQGRSMTSASQEASEYASPSIWLGHIRPHTTSLPSDPTEDRRSHFANQYVKQGRTSRPYLLPKDGQHDFAPWWGSHRSRHGYRKVRSVSWQLLHPRNSLIALL